MNMGSVPHTANRSAIKFGAGPGRICSYCWKEHETEQDYVRTVARCCVCNKIVKKRKWMYSGDIPTVHGICIIKERKQNARN